MNISPFLPEKVVIFFLASLPSRNFLWDLAIVKSVEKNKENMRKTHHWDDLKHSLHQKGLEQGDNEVAHPDETSWKNKTFY